MIRIRTQSPIAVSMVAGRVCKCGVGSRLLCMSVMGTLPGIEMNTSSKGRPKPEIWSGPGQSLLYANDGEGSRKFPQCQCIKGNFGDSAVNTMARGAFAAE